MYLRHGGRQIRLRDMRPRHQIVCRVYFPVTYARGNGDVITAAHGGNLALFAAKLQAAEPA